MLIGRVTERLHKAEYEHSEMLRNFYAIPTSHCLIGRMTFFYITRTTSLFIQIGYFIVFPMGLEYIEMIENKREK